MYLHEQEGEAAKDMHRSLLKFAERIQSMKPFFAYQLTEQSLWLARTQGETARSIIEYLRTACTAPLPRNMQTFIASTMGKQPPVTRNSVRPETVEAAMMHVKMSRTPGKSLRPYQEEAVQAFLGAPHASGVMVLPCGAGKTVVGVATMVALEMSAFILVPNEAAAMQWRTHILNWTSLCEDEVCIDDGRARLAPVTIATYQRLTARTKRGDYPHLKRYASRVWGVVIFDEVHLLPAPLFRLAAGLRALRRLGLSATLIREDGRATDVFSLVGPKCYEIYPEELVDKGYLAPVHCLEIAVPCEGQTLVKYESASIRERHRIAADNEAKMDVVQKLCQLHQGQQILVMGHYTDFLKHIAAMLGCPMLDGQTRKEERLLMYQKFREGSVSTLVLSRIANVAVDLPNADVAVQVSGLFGSRQEEAQRLGRLLRPHGEEAIFYTLVSQNTVEEKTARHRQRFLVEQGYAYETVTAAQILTKGWMHHET